MPPQYFADKKPRSTTLRGSQTKSIKILLNRHLRKLSDNSLDNIVVMACMVSRKMQKLTSSQQTN
jgi:hypothetical protein